MENSYKVRVKHLSEENTVESIPGEMIVSPVTGHISVKDRYFINSATKEIAARNSALNNFHDYLINDINHLDRETKNFKKTVNRLNDITNIEDISNPQPIDLNDTYIEIEETYNTAANFESETISLIEMYVDIEKKIKQIELTCKKLESIYQYILNQKYIYFENYELLKHDILVNSSEYRRLEKDGVISKFKEFKDEMRSKYKDLADVYRDKVKIEFDGEEL